MNQKKNNTRNGFTLVELVVTAVAAVILLIGISTMLAAGHRNFNTMYRRTTSDVVRNAYEARIIFDRIVRKSVIEQADLSSSRDTLVVYFYPDPGNLATLNDIPGRYAMFYRDGSNLRLQQGDINTWPPPPPPSKGSNDPIIASNVTLVEFTIVGASIRMALTLDNTNNPSITDKLSTLKLNVTTTAIRHNRLPGT